MASIMQNESIKCHVCGGPKATKTCNLCESQICKSCQETLPSGTFDYMMQIPNNLNHSKYCIRCYDSTVAPAIEKYQLTAQQAEDTYFLTRDYPGYIRVLKRHPKRISVEAGLDRRQTILQMAFIAAELGFNAIIDAQISSYTVRNGGYQTSRWKASSVPAQIDGDHLELTSLKRI